MEAVETTPRTRPTWLDRFLAGARIAAPAIGWSAAGLSLVFEVLGLGLMIVNRGSPLIPQDPYWGAAFVVGVAFPAVGALIVSRLPGHSLGWLFLLTGLSGALGWFSEQYAELAVLTGSETLPAVLTSAWIASWTGDLSFNLLLTFSILLFPDGHLPSRGWRPFARLTLVLLVLHTFLTALRPGSFSPWAGGVNPIGVGAGVLPWDAFEWLNGLPIYVPFVLVCVASPFVRLRRARGDERQQIKWFAFAAALIPISLGLNAIFPDLAWAIGGVAVALLPVAIGVAILNHHLYDIDLLINRTIVYAILTACVVAIYILTVGYLGALLQSSGSLAISLLGTGLVAVLFQPLRVRLQRAVNRLLYGERDEPYAVLARLGQRLESTLAPEAVLPTVVRTVAEALRLPYAAIALWSDQELAVDASYGIAVAGCLHLPLRYRGEEVGKLSLAPRSAGEAFSPADRRLLDDLASSAGVAVHAVSLTAELRRSRERLVVAREEERRRLRRDLHDGLGPALAAQILRVGTARALLEADLNAVDQLLSELEDGLYSTVADVRRLVYNLRPPALDDLGLVGALRASAAQCGGEESTGSLRVAVEVSDPLPALPAAVEVAAYRICQEALTNVVRHAGARTCQVRLTVERGRWLVLTVSDDGIGLQPETRAGVGLVSMRERAEELGGSFAVVAQPAGGARVEARLPLGAASDRAADPAEKAGGNLEAAA